MIRAIYCIVRLITLSIISTILLIIYTLERPNSILKVIERPLADLNISIDRVEGSPLYGFKIINFRYQNLVEFKSLNFKIDWDSLKDRLLKIEEMGVEDLHIEETLLNSLLESNGSSGGSAVALPVDVVEIDRGLLSFRDIRYRDGRFNSLKLKLDNLNIELDSNSTTYIESINIDKFKLVIDRGEYLEYRVDSGYLELNRVWSDIEHYRGDISLKLKSSIADGSIDGSLDDNHIDIAGYIEAKSPYLSRFIDCSDIRMMRDIKVDILKLEGDIDGGLNFNLKFKDIDILKGGYPIEGTLNRVVGSYNLKSDDLRLDIDGVVKGRGGEVSLRGGTSLNIGDLNSTLRYNLKSQVMVNIEFLNRYIDTIHISKISPINLELSGDMGRGRYRVKSGAVEVVRDDIYINSPVDISGGVSISGGDVDYRATLKPESTIGYGDIESRGEFNFKRFKSTFKQSSIFDIYLNSGYLNTLLYDNNLTITKNPHISGDVRGGIALVDTGV